MHLNPTRFGMACAVATGTFYLGCVFLMTVSEPTTLTHFFNGLFHGLDLRPILVDKVSFWMTLCGFINTVILSWFFGALLASVYNFGTRKENEK